MSAGSPAADSRRKRLRRARRGLCACAETPEEVLESSDRESVSGSG